jgi:hypothetical protein
MASPAMTASPHDAAWFLRPSLSPGQVVSHVFSRTISTQGDGIEPVVKRVSGTGTYRLTSVGAHGFFYTGTFLYDGLPAATGDGEVRKDGRENCWQKECTAATDASGLIMNPTLWGSAPKKIGVGTKWHVHVSTAWELGPPGDEEITVTSLQAETGTAVLERHGQGEGAFDHDATQLKVTGKGVEHLVAVQPGRSSWSGQTVITRGLIVSDELMVERDLVLSAQDLGTIAARQRQYILLNQAPRPASWN